LNYLPTSRSVRLLLLFLITAFSSINFSAQATHLRAGEIIIERVNCQALTFRITVIAYTDCEPADPVLFGEGILTFGDGSDPDRDGTPGIELPQIQNIHRDDLGDGVCYASFTIDHTYSSNGTYKIGYVEPNRNEGVLNIDNSVNTTFYVETEIDIDPFLGCNNSPVLLIPPIDRACPGVAFFHNPGAYDPDGDSLSFELVTPKQDKGLVVNGYLPINDDSFYENPNQGNEDLNGPPEFEIDPITGEITWDAPGAIGEYNIAFIVREWRKFGGQYVPMGYVTRDMQIIVEDCDNERPELKIPDDVCVEAGTTINETIYGTDPDNDDVKIEAFSQVFGFGATVSPDDGEFYSSVPDAELQFEWETECVDVREQPYQVVFKITDNPDQGPSLVSFETWNITVVGPRPIPTNLAQEGQGLRLDWDPYICQNAETIQIWRRVDSNPFVPGECETGMPENAGYTMIKEVPVTTSTFKDMNLAAAAKYCYRLVAQFRSPGGGESIVSDELCFEYVPAEEPVITHVSVEKTDETNGEIVVAWREPFDLGTLVAPFTFKVYRAEGFEGDLNLTEVAEITTSNTDSTTLSIRDTGLNTLDNVYNYRISIVDPEGGNSGDEVFSATASSVRLEPTPLFNQIQIDWSATVPWSNSISFPPGSEHLIYRGLEGTAEEDLQFLAKVDVNQNGFTYIDSANIDDEKVYCYKVLTKGTYGNPEINGTPGVDFKPQFNYSQMVCTQASDSIPPCQPVVSIEGPNCDELADQLCNSASQTYRNTIRWSTDFVGECQDDIRAYELYFANQTTSEFELLATVRDTFYIHQKTDSYKGCYRVKAIDRSGNESELSEVFCVDNCPNYELPNLLTPNGDHCNDIFQAFGAPENSDGICAEQSEGFSSNRSRCARFVQSVRFTVYNRWGQPIYTFDSEENIPGQESSSIYINWDGRDDKGAEVPSGVYYYLAEVVFDVVNPGEAKKNIKGWVHIVR